MRPKKPRNFYEPWTASINHAWQVPFRFGPPTFASVSDPDLRDMLLAEWEGNKGRAETNADWVVWGSRMAEPCGLRNLAGVPGFDQGRAIIAVTRHLDWPEPMPAHKEVAERIAACVSAMAGVGNPVEAMIVMRDVLVAIAGGDPDYAALASDALQILGQQLS